MRKYTLKQFCDKYAGKRHISCGINYVDGKHDTMLNASFSQIMSWVKDKEIAFIVSR